MDETPLSTDPNTPEQEPVQTGQQDVSLNTPSSAEPAADTRTAGSMLREMREAANADIETLASALKVSPQKLRALEADDYTALPALFFARGLAANVCRHLGQDPAPVLAKMPGEKPRFALGQESKAALPRHIEPVSMGKSGGLPRWLVALFVLLLLAGAGIYALPWLSARMPKSFPAATSGASVTPAAANTAAPVPAAEPVPPASSASAAAALPTLAPAHSSASAATTPPSPPASAASETATTDNRLQIVATGDTWVRVMSPTGRKLFEATLIAGQQKDVTIAQYPVRVIVGRAENTQIVDRGQTFDLASVAPQGVARFEIKP